MTRLVSSTAQSPLKFTCANVEGYAEHFYVDGDANDVKRALVEAISIIDDVIAYARKRAKNRRMKPEARLTKQKKAPTP